MKKQLFHLSDISSQIYYCRSIENLDKAKPGFIAFYGSSNRSTFYQPDQFRVVWESVIFYSQIILPIVSTPKNFEI